MRGILAAFDQKRLFSTLKKRVSRCFVVVRMSTCSRTQNSLERERSLRDRFRGCLVGAVIGDCLGAQFEGLFLNPIDRATIEAKIGVHSVELNKKKDSFYKFTDDTAMTRSVCSSLIEMNDVDASHLASKFLEEFTKEKARGYGPGMFKIFEKWQKRGTVDNPLLPAIEQFSGSGSYGNGAAMRIAPVALFSDCEETLIKLSKETALLTHTNKQGYNGAILQALAVSKTLDCIGVIDKEQFISSLLAKMSQIEGVDASSVKGNRRNHPVRGPFQRFSREPDFTFTSQLLYMASLLTEPRSAVDTNIIVSNIGNDITAQEAVSAAIWSFVFTCDKDFVETLIYAVSLGGDTDTIATMACAIAGAYFGASAIPMEWRRVCEGVNDAYKFADQFYDRLYEQMA